MKPGENKYQSDPSNQPLIFEWIRNHQNEKAINHLQAHPKEIHWKGWMGDTPLHIAALSDNLEMVKYLLGNGAAVNASRTGVYATPLCWAASKEIAEYLLQQGATMNDLELYRATITNRIAVIDILLSNGAKIKEEEPQYLQCQSIAAIQVYLDHQINIQHSDKYGSNLLHKLAWLNLPVVFDFAWSQGVPWKKDHSTRTPFVLARQGGKHQVVQFLAEKYPALISIKIKKWNVDLGYEKILYLLTVPNQPATYIALTENRKLIKYKVNKKGAMEITQAIEVDIPMIRNFTINASNQLILPTGDNQLLRFDASSFELLETLSFADENTFDQITYLPKRKVYIGSSDNWNITILNENFEISHQSEAEEGTFYPLVNQEEDLLAYWSYDHLSYFNLYRLELDFKISFIHTFFENSKSVSKGFTFAGEELVVAFPKKLETYQLEGTTLTKTQEWDITKHSSAYDVCSLVTLSSGIFVLGKGNHLIAYRKQMEWQQRAIIPLDLKNDIRHIYYDKATMNLLVTTDSEIKRMNLQGKNWAI